MRYISKLLFLNLFILCTLEIFAVPAPPYPQLYKQKNGTEITVILKGDEKTKWAETMDGYSLLKNAEGIFEYAVKNESGDMLPSGVKASELNRRSRREINYVQSLAKGLRYSSSQLDILRQFWEVKNQNIQQFSSAAEVDSQMKIRKIPIILVAYTDVVFKYAKSNFEALLNQADYTLDGATGSAYDYFKDNSRGTLSFTFDVFGPYTLSQAQAYYGGNDRSGNDKNPREMVKEALAAAASDGCDYSKYDFDRNGSLDGLHIIFAGGGEENGGGDGAIWSHAWTLQDDVIYNEISISSYSCSPELGSGTSMTNVGVVIHEISHVLGLPDLYDTDYSSQGQSIDLGVWDPMAGGSWNNDGKTPPLHNVWSRSKLGWQEIHQLSDSADIFLRPAEEESRAYMYATKTRKENYWLENRGFGKWDAGLPGKGLLIYHVDENNTQWRHNCINCSPSKRGFYIKQANGGDASTMEHGAGTPFPGSYNNTSFTDTSAPNALSWAKVATGKPITDIRLLGNIIVFKFNGGAPSAKDTTFGDVEISSILSPINDGFLGSAQPLTIAIKNNAGVGMKYIPVACELNGVHVFTDTIAELDSAKAIEYTFSKFLNLYNEGEYTIRVNAIVLGDTNLSNNSAQLTLKSFVNDVAMLNLVSPSGVHPFSAREKIIYEVENKGLFPVDTAYIHVKVNNFIYYDTLYNLPLGITVDSLDQTVDMSDASYNYAYTLTVVVLKDINLENNTLGKIFPQKTKLEMEKNINEISIYPNPARDYIYVHAMSVIEGIELIDMKGVVKKLPVATSNEQVLDIQNYPKGNYILRFCLGTGRNYSKSIVLF